MSLYSLDKLAMARCVIIGDFDSIKRSVYAAGNTEFSHVDDDILGHPIIKCDIKPKDDIIMGIVWREHEIEA